MAITEVKLSTIQRDTSIQCRASLDMAVINDYTEHMTAGDKFPPVILFGTKDKCWIGDGWHRIGAAETLEHDSIEAELRPGGRVDALKFALSANAVHGVRRRREDIKRCVEIALKEFPDLSNRQVAEICGVSHQMIDNYRRNEVPIIGTCDTKRLGADGKAYPAHPKQPAREPEPDYQEGWQTVEPDSEEETEWKDEEEEKPRGGDQGLNLAEYAIGQINRITKLNGDRGEAFMMIIRKIVEMTKRDRDPICAAIHEGLGTVLQSAEQAKSKRPTQ